MRLPLFSGVGQILGRRPPGGRARRSIPIVERGLKVEPNQCDLSTWVYDIGENSDCSADALVSDNVRELCELFRMLPTAKASFATKFVNRELLQWEPMGRTRIRASLMPHETAKVTDIRTSPVVERTEAINDFAY